MKLRYAVLVIAMHAALAAAAVSARAQEGQLGPHDTRTDLDTARDDCRRRHDRRGWFVGFDLGAGGGKLRFETPAIDHDPDAELGFLAAFRFGYAVSNSIAFAVEAHGFGRSGNGSDWSGGALFGSLTWWPDGSGFFLRLGVGGGGVDLIEPHADGVEHELEREGSAGAFGLGYEWRVGRTFALGLSADLVGIDLDDTDNLRDLAFGYGGFAVQFHWYL